VYVDVTSTQTKVKVKVTGLLNFRQLAKPCMLVAMTTAPIAGLSGFLLVPSFILIFFVKEREPVSIRVHHIKDYPGSRECLPGVTDSLMAVLLHLSMLCLVSW